MGSADGELGIDPGEAGEERLAEGGVGAEQLGGDDEQAEQLVAGLGAEPGCGSSARPLS